jgi:shikimate dehydrogenase
MQKLFTIFGNPVKHSRSPLMHNTVFKKLNYPACYTRSCLEDGTKLREQFVRLRLSGANITIPHKEAAYKACDEVRGFAKKVGVVNTIVYEDGKLVGYNTDADGFMYAISEFISVKNVIILGAGGTAKALATKFLEEHMTVTVLNRSQGRLAYFNQIGCKTYTWENFDLDSYDLVVNTTSAGLNDDSLPAPVEYIEAILDSSRYAADAIYGKLTPFLQMAKEKKIIYKDGADMLLGQGVLANELFTGKQLSRKAIEAAMRKSFAL